MANYVYFLRPPLSSVVELFWFDERVAHPSNPPERVLPTGASVLIINFHAQAIRLSDGPRISRMQALGDAIMCGPRSEVFAIDRTIPTAALGVQFKPGGARSFFSLPASELVNAHVSLDALWGSEAGFLREQLLEAVTVDEKFRVMEKALLQRLCRSPSGHPAVAYAMREFDGGRRRITEITRHIGLSPQWFRRVFHEEVGLAPKVYYRVRRFQQVLQYLVPGQDIDWASLALACGYFDQAHFIHDFQAFSGLSPTDYVNHLAEPGGGSSAKVDG